jgi:potassium-transporting ATPase KdpC subunit
MKRVMVQLRPAVLALVMLSVLTGGAYPAIVTWLAQTLWPAQANGSLLRVHDKVIGSSLIGQAFGAPFYLWGRPSATAERTYNAMASGGSNLGANNPALIDAMRARADALRNSNPGQRLPVPVDLVTASASGLDPELSLAGALWQAPRIAHARGVTTDRVEELIRAQAMPRWLGVFGEPRVNVLALNLALDAALPPQR